MSNQRYSVQITPLHYDGIYGDVIDVTQDVDISDLIMQSGLGRIKKEFDNGDYDIGIFVFGDITLKCINSSGRFNDAHDFRTIFKYKRDLAKIKVLHFDRDDVETIVFEGLINEDGTRADAHKDTIRLKVLSYDSIFDQVQVSGGVVATGVTISTAIKQILNTTDITSVLGFDPSDINVDADFIIDDGDHFTGLTVKEALDGLLIASNSILYIDSNKDIIVSNREEGDNVHELYGEHDPLGRGNILKITEYNSGIQRAFSAVQVNDTEVLDQAYIDIYGYRKKSISLDFINNLDTEEVISQRILDEFKVPRPECKVKVRAVDILGVELLDQAKIDHPYRFAPANGQGAVPTVATTVIGETQIPKVFGSLKITPNIKWKVTGIEQNPKDFTATLRLRHAGKIYGEGYY